jgi:hypothetical protein
MLGMPGRAARTPALHDLQKNGHGMTDAVR